MTLSNCWPRGVLTESDNKNFLKLLFADAPTTDLTPNLPRCSWDDAVFAEQPCFLSFVRGIQNVNDLKMIEASFGIFQEQVNWERLNGNYDHADRLHNVVGKVKTFRYYRQATLNGASCDCKISFGGDVMWKKTACPRAASSHLHGRMLENCLRNSMKANYDNPDLFRQDASEPLPHWMDPGTFHCLFNEYHHSENNSIEFHDDNGTTYDHLDPISSFTFKTPGVLLVKRKNEGRKSKSKSKGATTLLVFQQPGDCVVMSGYFQEFYQHAVPARSKWQEILSTGQYEGIPVVSPAGHWNEFQKICVGLQNCRDEALMKEWDVRWNCTLRWHRHHQPGNCRYARTVTSPPVVAARPQPGPVHIKNTMQQLHTWSTFPPASFRPAILVGTGQSSSTAPPVMGAVTAASSTAQPVMGAVTVVWAAPLNAAIVGGPPQAQAAQRVCDSTQSFDDQPSRPESMGPPQAAAPAAATAGPRVSDSTHSFDDRSDRSGTRRWEKRSYPQPQEAEPAAADDPEESPLKKLNLAYAAMIKLQVQNLGATNTSNMLRLGEYLPFPLIRKDQVQFLTDLFQRIEQCEEMIREAMNQGHLTGFSPESMDSDSWLTSLSKSRTMIDTKLSVLTQLHSLDEFYGECQWLNVSNHSFQVNRLQNRRHLRRCPVQGKDFVDWLNRNTFDLQALKENGWLTMKHFIPGALQVKVGLRRGPRGEETEVKLVRFDELFKGAVVLETIDFSMSDLQGTDTDNAIPSGLFQVTIIPSVLKSVCEKLEKKEPESEATLRFANQIQSLLKSLVILMEALSNNDQCFLNLWVVDYQTKKGYRKDKKKKMTQLSQLNDFPVILLLCYNVIVCGCHII